MCADDVTHRQAGGAAIGTPCPPRAPPLPANDPERSILPSFSCAELLKGSPIFFFSPQLEAGLVGGAPSAERDLVCTRAAPAPRARGTKHFQQMLSTPSFTPFSEGGQAPPSPVRGPKRAGTEPPLGFGGMSKELGTSQDQAPSQPLQPAAPHLIWK